MKAACYLWTVQFFRNLSDNELSLQLDGEHINPDIYENLSVCPSYVILWTRNMHNGELCNITFFLYGSIFFRKKCYGYGYIHTEMRRRMCLTKIHSNISAHCGIVSDIRIIVNDLPHKFPTCFLILKDEEIQLNEVADQIPSSTCENTRLFWRIVIHYI